MMNNSQQTKEPQDQLLFSVDAETFRQFCELLDAPAKDNPGLARLMTLTPPWSKAPDIESAGETN
jgi:uncharacterized protein (DUF1778 family)